jgi:hypothetical protein
MPITYAAACVPDKSYSRNLSMYLVNANPQVNTKYCENEHNRPETELQPRSSRLHHPACSRNMGHDFRQLLVEVSAGRERYR